MKEQELLLKELALMLERQDMLSKLTEGKCLDEYGYSETHCIDYIGRLELPNVTKIAEHMGMTRGAISKMTKKLLTKGLIEKYTLESNKKEVYFKLTDLGKTLFEEHAKRHKRWESIATPKNICRNCYPLTIGSRSIHTSSRRGKSEKPNIGWRSTTATG